MAIEGIMPFISVIVAAAGVGASMAAVTDYVSRKGTERFKSEANQVKNLLDQYYEINLHTHQINGNNIRLDSSAEKNKATDATWTLVEGLVENYHRQALTQATVQFYFSLAVSILGFALIVSIFVFSMATNTVDFLLKSTPGLLVNAIAAVFFKQSASTRERATELYDRIRVDNQRARAMELVAGIENSALRSAVRAQLAMHMAGIDSKAVDLSTYLAASGHQTPPAVQPTSATSIVHRTDSESSGI